MPKNEAAPAEQREEEVRDLEGLVISDVDVKHILEGMEKVVPTDWLVGRTWDGTRKEFAEILKTGRFPSRLRFFRLTIPDQKLFLQFLGTAVTLGMVAGSMVYHWASVTLGTEYLGAFGWAMIPVGAATSWLITKIDGGRRQKQNHIVEAIRTDAKRAAELLENQRKASEIFQSLFHAFEKAGYRRTENLLGMLQEITTYYSPLSRKIGKEDVIAALEGGEYPILYRNGNEFTVVSGSVPISDEIATEDGLIREVRRRINEVVAAAHAPTDRERDERWARGQLHIR
ncbi:MAG TPA: hypothetical protein VJ246_03850 [Patescibacteria group bacterium]|nr:hypothetical protein [Patescibacteria group bacterium]